MIMKTKHNKKNNNSLISIVIYVVFLLSIPVYGNDANLNINQIKELANSMIDSDQTEKQDIQENTEQNQQEQIITEEKKEESTTETTKNESEQPSKESQDTATQQPTKKTVDECVQILLTGDKVIQLSAIATCANEYQDNEKMQDALIQVIQNSDDDKIIMSSLLLLSNKKNDKISESLVNMINNNKFKDSKIQSYSAAIVLFSSLSDKFKAQAKEIFNNYSSSEDELLKHLSEQLAKKD